MNQAVATSAGDSDAAAGKPVVLQVVPRLVSGGVERGTVDIAAAITAAGGTSIVASEGGPMEHQLARAGVLHIKLPVASKNPFVMRGNVSRLWRLIRRHDVQIVHARSRAPAWSAAIAARTTGAHFVTTFHGTYNAGNLFKKRYNAIMTKGERVIAISQFIASHIRENYAVDPARIRVIQRGVDLNLFDPAKVSAERVVQLATRWRLPDGVPVIMLPGRFSRWKGQALLVEALAGLDMEEFCCVLVGPDRAGSPYRREVEEAIAARGLGGKAYVMEGCDDMPAAYMLADVVVSASTDPEAFGRVVSEAQAMGRPVVASNHGGAPEQVIDGRTAFLFPPGDPAGLAAGLRRALALSPGERKQLAYDATTNVQKHFSKVRMCSDTLALYQELLPADAYDGAALARA